MNKSLPEVEKFKYLRVLFTGAGRKEQEMNRWIRAIVLGVKSGTQPSLGSLAQSHCASEGVS